MDVKGYLLSAFAIFAVAVVILTMIVTITRNINESNSNDTRMKQYCISQGYSGYDSVIGCFGGSQK